MEILLKKLWQKHCELLNIKSEASSELWDEISEHYTQAHRAYHNLQHINDLFQLMEQVKTSLFDLPALYLAIWYHDIIYNPLAKDNEEKSADLALSRLKHFSFPVDFLQKVHKLIVSTKSHQSLDWKNAADQSDNAYLLDMDLSILGRPWQDYLKYTQQVRREYKVVPGFLYRRGRKKVLKHFLDQEQLFKTDYFSERFELQAKSNLASELKSL